MVFFKSKIKLWFYYNVVPKIVDYIVRLSVVFPAKNINKKNANRILLDSNIYDAAIIMETAWVGTKIKNWGDIDEVNTGYAARIPVHDDSDKSKTANSIKYLPGIIALARKQAINLFDSNELKDERFTQPVGRFKGYGLYDYSLFENVKIEMLSDQEYHWVMGPKNLNIPSLKEQRKLRLNQKRQNKLYDDLVKTLGEKNSQDAWHIFTAETNNCYCFLTMDFNLIKNINSQKGSNVIKNLKTKIMTPEDFGKEFDLIVIPPRLFSYHQASFPVIHDQNWKNSKRRNKS